jgi:hypothetical protein
VEPNTGLHHLNAPPESDDYHPPHAGRLLRIEELKKVAGWADFTSQPGWDNDFTVNTGQGVDLTWASRDVLLALGPEFGPDQVDRFLQLRQGPDGIDGTEDDMVFKSNDEVLLTMGISQDRIAPRLKKVLSQTVPVPVFRINSTGRSGRATRTVQAVFTRIGTQPSIITWKEF